MERIISAARAEPAALFRISTADFSTGQEHSWVKRSFRLTKSTKFQRVRRFGKSYAHPLIVLVALHVAGEPIQVGISASRAVGGAVQRNRAKRLLREVIRPLLPSLIPGWHIILICRQPILTSSFAETNQALTHLLHKAGLLNTQDGN